MSVLLPLCYLLCRILIWLHIRTPPNPALRAFTDAPLRLRARTLIHAASQAIEELIAFTKSTQEPFSPEMPAADNPWIGGKSGGSSPCCIL